MISIIIPVFNEEAGISSLLDYIQKKSAGFIDEILVVDGGSTDNTSSIVSKRTDAKILPSKRGRAVQMNTGAKVATAEILYFLHADSLPPENFDQLIVNQVKKGNKAGCFCMKFDKNHWWLKMMGWFTRVNHISCRGGDQSLFVEKALFKKIGGYNESYIVYEDNEIAKRLYEEKHFVIIKEWLTTSSRLYERMGIWNTQFLFCEIYWKKRRGATPEELYQHYYKRFRS